MIGDGAPDVAAGDTVAAGVAFGVTVKNAAAAAAATAAATADPTSIGVRLFFSIATAPGTPGVAAPTRVGGTGAIINVPPSAIATAGMSSTAFQSACPNSLAVWYRSLASRSSALSID